MLPGLYTSTLPLLVGWIGIEGDNDPAGGGEHKIGGSTIGGRTVRIPECRVWYIEPQHESNSWTWPDVINEVSNSNIPGLSTGKQIDDSVLAQIGRLNHLRHLDLTRCHSISDQGLLNLKNLHTLESLYLNGCTRITNEGLAVLQFLPNLKVLRLSNLPNITDNGIANLQSHELLQLVSLSRSNVGDTSLLYLANKPSLTHLSLGDQTTDNGLAILSQFPGLTSYQEGRPKHQINEYASPSVSAVAFDLRGNIPITESGLAHLSILDGVYEICVNANKESTQITGKGTQHIAKMKNLRVLWWAENLCNDDALTYIGKMKNLEHLWCFGSVATDIGYQNLKNCLKLQQVFASGDITRKSLNALSHLPSLSILHIDGTHLPDKDLDVLPHFKKLAKIYPTRFGDEAFHYIGKVQTLEHITNMYCQNTSDMATKHLSRLPELRAYNIWTTQITDSSLSQLSEMETLEKLLFQKCPNITDSGISNLTRLPNLKNLSLQKCQGLTSLCTEGFRKNTLINYTPAI